MRKLIKIPGACVPCALQYASGIDEETVLRICALHGFEAGEGMCDHEYLEAAADLKMKLKRVNVDAEPLNKFMRRHKNGLYLLVTFDHMFVLDSSIIVDPRNKRAPGLWRVIREAYRVLR